MLDPHENKDTCDVVNIKGLECLTDELTRLDLRISIEFIRKKTQKYSNPLEQYLGLVLSEEEISGLLSQDAWNLKDEEIEKSTYELSGKEEQIKELDDKIREKRKAFFQENYLPPLYKLSHIFNLSPFEEQCLIICLAPEIDNKYERLYAYLQDDITKKNATIGLILDLLCSKFLQKIGSRIFFAPQAPLFRYRLVKVVDGVPEGCAAFPSRLLKVDDRIADYLLGIGDLDARLSPVARLISPKVRLQRVTIPEELQARTRSFVRANFAETSSEKLQLLFSFRGPSGTGKKSLAEAISNDLDKTLLWVDVGRMLRASNPFEEIVCLLGREVVLHSAALCLEGFDRLLADDEQNSSRLNSLLEKILMHSSIAFFLGIIPWRPPCLSPRQFFIDIEFPVPDPDIRKRLWEENIKRMSLSSGRIDYGALADKFRFTAGQIEEAAVVAKNLTKWRSSATEEILSEHLHSSCRSLSNTRLIVFARKIEPVYSMQNIVLPPDPMKQLVEVCNQVRYRHIVYGDWGFGRKLSLGKGLAVLFSGPPGTGKTMAAEVIANELKLDLYRIDLSQVVSKYIGETEKNLHRIFTEAETSNAILFFDEADALFGKRSEVKDAHDRYANIEIGYLLQKMEEYEGVSILTTNMRSNMDEAFVRRLQMTVDFPFPDAEHREKIWKSIFPKELPLSKGIDFVFLANRFKIAGGNIKNIAIMSAFFAAEKGEMLTMSNILQAVRREMQKMGRICTKAELGEYYDLLEI